MLELLLSFLLINITHTLLVESTRYERKWEINNRVIKVAFNIFFFFVAD